MSSKKRVSNNSILNYFSPTRNSDSPSTSKKSNGTNSSHNLANTPKRAKSDSEDETVQPTKKFKRKALIDDYSDDENVDTANTSAPTTPSLSAFKKTAKSGSTPTPKKLKKDENEKQLSSEDFKPLLSREENWPHLHYSFMQSKNIMDANKRRPDHPEYNPRTLYVPKDFILKQTPAMQQWWELKSKNFDTVLFFKVGKFYELYHMDAVVGVQDLGFSYMKGDFAHSGFPETAYDKMASFLVELGHKIARVEQTETPEMMEKRNKEHKGGKSAKVVKREICQISTKATKVYGPNQEVPKFSQPVYLYAIKEKIMNTDDNFGDYFKFGVCFIDTSVGTFFLSEFNDDKHCSKLLSLFAHYPPGLLLLERRGISEYVTEKILPLIGDHVKKEMLLPKVQFYTSDNTLERIKEGKYFVNQTEDGEETFYWPESLASCIDSDPMGVTCKPEFELAISCLGACLYHLSYSELDIQLFSLGNFKIYEHSEMNVCNKQNREYMVIDSVTVQNLHLIGREGSLQKTLDRCITSFAKRALPKWICRPLCNINLIKERQEAVQELLQNPSHLDQAREILHQLPDFERDLFRLHTFGNKILATNHPDSRAIFYESKIYSKRKLRCFLITLNGFDKAQKFQSLFQKFESPLIKRITQFECDGGEYVDTSEIIESLMNKFDLKTAQQQGKIIPQHGEHDAYDAVNKKIDNIQKKLNDYLQEQKEHFGCKVVYFGTDKKRYQIEVPENKVHKATNEYQLESYKKGSKRYSTATTKALLAEMISAENEREKVLLDINRGIFEQFSKHYGFWNNNAELIKVLDILCSFAEFARTCSGEVCVPEILSLDDENPFLSIEEGRHPCLENMGNFVSNDTFLGKTNFERILLLTGPNMGGKSTLMRQVALLSIMAQMGCVVPATSMKFTCIDRIFTRIGARDEILSKRSTFMIELCEAASILKNSSNSSLLLIDELGRGTSTHDGTAIATAYVQYLKNTKCRTIFSTHYHNLVDTFEKQSGYQFGHMACLVENEEDDISERNITFLYKLTDGRCPKSYGFYAARLAALPDHIIKEGQKFSKNLLAIEQRRVVFQKFCQLNSIIEYKELLREIKKRQDILF